MIRERDFEVDGHAVRVVERATLVRAGGFAWASLTPVAVIVDGRETRLDGPADGSTLRGP